MKKYDLDRKTAGQILDVSTRTVDRYIKANKLSTRVMGGRVWLNKEEVERVSQGKSSRQDVDKVKLSTSDMSRLSIDKDDPELNTVHLLTRHNVDTSRQNRKKAKVDPNQKIYFSQIQDSHKKLEQTNYELGKMESQLQNSIPLSLHYQHLQNQKDQENKLKFEMLDLEFQTKKARVELKFQKFIKWLLFLLIICILILQPLWLLLLK
ncbi:hypothetical protein ACFL21_04345 [Patescibacteria group bacterium]